MIETIKNRTMAQAWRILLQHKILWLYAVVFSVLFYVSEFVDRIFHITHEYFDTSMHYTFSATWRVRIQLGLVMVVLFVLVSIGRRILGAAFYINALSWPDNKRISFVNSFKLGAHFRGLVFWAVIVSLISFLSDLLSSLSIVGEGTLIFRITKLFCALFHIQPIDVIAVHGGIMFGIFRLLLLVLGQAFVIGATYVTIVLATSKASVGASIKRSFLLMRHTWLSLLGVFFEVIVYGLTLHILFMIGIFGHNYKLIFLPFIVWPLFCAATVVLYKRELIRAK